MPNTFDTAVTATSFVPGQQLIQSIDPKQAVVGQRNVSQNGARALGQLLPRHEIRMMLHFGQQDFVPGRDVRRRPNFGQRC